MLVRVILFHVYYYYYYYYFHLRKVSHRLELLKNVDLYITVILSHSFNFHWRLP